MKTVPRAVPLLASLILLAGLAAAADAAPPHSLPSTQPLDWSGDIASNLVAGVDRFLLRKLDESVAARAAHWRRDPQSADSWNASVLTNRQYLAQHLGLRDLRSTSPIQFLGPWPITNSSSVAISHIRWSALGDVHGDGLMLTPQAIHSAEELKLAIQAAPAFVIAVPDADQTPPGLAGLTDEIPAALSWARRLADSGCAVVIPTLINRQRGGTLAPDGKRGASLSNREFLYRSAFVLGRTVPGYEVEKVLALVDRVREASASKPVGVFGCGEGGLIALAAAALDIRISSAGVSGYFEPREHVWEQPIERNLFGWLVQAGDAELASLVAPRRLVIEAAAGPEVEVKAGSDAAPGILRSPAWPAVQREFARAQTLIKPLRAPDSLFLVAAQEGHEPSGSEAALQPFLAALAPGLKLAPPPEPGPRSASDWRGIHQEQLHELDRHNQQLLRESPYVRQAFLAKLDTSSPEAHRLSAVGYREFFAREVIGEFADPLLPPQPRSRLILDQPKWRGYEVVLDVWPDVFAYGVLLVPKDLREDEKRPVVVCQHGLEGRPLDTIQGDHWAYHDFAARLAERGFITFAPQNLYLFGDRFRTLQRKANPLGKTLFSIIVPQHRQITGWLKTLPFVDPARIAFYGLSYGGKSAMRVPSLVEDYCLSICSADFNEWVWKNASTRSPYSYVWTGEYEIFEWDLGSTFNYAEMAALIAPRPFMVERGHFDGVAPDETVAYEFAKVQHLYAAKLKIPERCEIEWFAGPHTINGRGTFAFLHRHLRWPTPP